MEIINVSYLEEVCGGSREIVSEMIGIFKDQVTEFYNEMSKLLEEKEYYDLGLLAHKAKSSIAIMGMEDLAMKLKDLEQKAKTGEDTDSYPGYIYDFKAQTKIAISELDIYLNSIKE
ncbi:MAG: Hpt domain-containing protein [Bacteroidales bacterium]|nr:Hpt domain-containing protein [Bacteroidales bacterium]